MTQTLTLTFDVQINLIAALNLFVLVTAPVPAGILLTNRPEGQRGPVDFGPLCCDWYSFCCFQLHPGNIYGSSLGRRGLVQWAAQIDSGALCCLYCLQDFALWKGHISLQDLLLNCECWELVNLTLYFQSCVLNINAVPATPDFTTVQPFIWLLQLGQINKMGSVFIKPQFYSFSIREVETFGHGKNNWSDTGGIFNPLDSVAATFFHLRITGKQCLFVQRCNH